MSQKKASEKIHEHSRDAVGSEKEIVGLMDRFPTDRKKQRVAPVERKPLKWHTRQLTLGLSVSRNTTAGRSCNYVVAGACGGNTERSDVDGRDGERQLGEALQLSLDLKKRIKEETMRHVRMMSAKQVLLCRDEAALLRLTGDVPPCGGASPKFQGGSHDKFGEKIATAVNSATALGAQCNKNLLDDIFTTIAKDQNANAMMENNKKKQNSSVFILADNDGPRPLPSRFLPLLRHFRGRDEWQCRFAKKIPLRQYFEELRENSDMATKPIGKSDVLCGRAFFRDASKCGERSRKMRTNTHKSVFAFFRKLFFTRLVFPSPPEQLFDFSSVAVRRLIGVPNHDRGLYAGLRQGWFNDSKAKRFARLLCRGRVQPSSWWMLANSYEGMVDAAKVLGLDPEVYKNLVTPWMWNKKPPNQSLRHAPSLRSETFDFPSNSRVNFFKGENEGNVATTGRTLEHALQSVFAGSPLHIGEKENLRMQTLAQQLGCLRSSGLVSAEELGQLLDAGDEQTEKELNRLLALAATNSKTSVLPLTGSDVITIARESAELLNGLASNLLKEKRRAAMQKVSHKKRKNVLGQNENFVEVINDQAGLLRGSGEYQTVGDREGILRSDEYKTAGSKGEIFRGTEDQMFKDVQGDMQQSVEHQAAKGSRSLPFINANQRSKHLQGIKEVLFGEMSASSQEENSSLSGVEPQIMVKGKNYDNSFHQIFLLRGPDDGKAIARGQRSFIGRHGAVSAKFCTKLSTKMPPDLNCSDSAACSLSEAYSALGSNEGRNDMAFTVHNADNCQNNDNLSKWLENKYRRKDIFWRGDQKPGEEEEEEDKEEAGKEWKGGNENKDTTSQFRYKKGTSRNLEFASRRRRRLKNKHDKETTDGSICTEETRGEGGQLNSPCPESDFDYNKESAGQPRSFASVFSGYLRKRAEVTVNGTDGGRARRRGVALPPFVKKIKTSGVSSPVKTVGSSEFDNTDQKELSSLFADDEEDLLLFLATFPEEESHVRLRNEAKGVLGGLDEEGSALLNYVTNARQRVRSQFALNAHRSAAKTSPIKKELEDKILKMNIKTEELHHRFEMEARECNAELWQTLQELRQKVLEQERLIKQSDIDVINLSRPAPGEERDAYALYLTEEVNKYAKIYRIDPKCLTETFKTRKNYAAAVQAFLSSFAVTRGRRPGYDVGCQCNPEDLGYVNDDIKHIEAEMEDLYFHARELLNAIRLTTVAVGNVIAFHSSLELESTCRYCFCIFENPRTLWPCGHTFCQHCLAFLFADNGELICDECGSLCEVGYTPNFALELLASYQVMQHSDHYDNDDEESDYMFNTQRRSIEGVLVTLLRDLMSTQLSIVDARWASVSRPQSRALFTAEISRPETAM